MQTTNNFKLTALFIAIVLVGLTFKAKADEKKMNIIFCLIDDMGWMDTGVYGSEYYETPNIDKFAEKGMRFTNAYSANPLCSPTRASILTGRYPARYDFTSAAGHLPANTDMVPGLKNKGAAWQKVSTPNIRTYMPLEEQTIAEVLKKEGYTTAHIGKWHLGDADHFPEIQGFDKNIGGYALGWPRSYFSPYNNEKLPDGPDGEYITDRITTEAINFIKSNKEKPFYLNLWHFAVHGPFHAKKELVEKYENKHDPRGRQGFAVMAAMIESLDQNMGRLFKALEDEGIMDNTIIIFTSDNGGVEYIAHHGETITNNYPLRSGKANVHEGGIRVPCIVYWHGQTKGGTVSRQPISSVDFFPTMIDMVKADKSLLENKIDGVSLVDVLKSDKPLNRKGIFVDFPHYTIAPANYPSTVLINDNWKFIRVYGHAPNRENFYELYKINEDIKEEFNVAANYPKVVKKLDALISDHIKEIGHYEPAKNPEYDAKVESPLGKTLKKAKIEIQ